MKQQKEKRASWWRRQRWESWRSTRPRRHKMMKQLFLQSQLCRSSGTVASNSPTPDTNFSIHPFLFFDTKLFNQVLSFIGLLLRQLSHSPRLLLIQPSLSPTPRIFALPQVLFINNMNEKIRGMDHWISKSWVIFGVFFFWNIIFIHEVAIPA